MLQVGARRRHPSTGGVGAAQACLPDAAAFFNVLHQALIPHQGAELGPLDLAQHRPVAIAARLRPLNARILLDLTETHPEGPAAAHVRHVEVANVEVLLLPEVACNRRTTCLTLTPIRARP